MISLTGARAAEDLLAGGLEGPGLNRLPLEAFAAENLRAAGLYRLSLESLELEEFLRAAEELLASVGLVDPTPNRRLKKDISTTTYILSQNCLDLLY